MSTAGLLWMLGSLAAAVLTAGLMLTALTIRDGIRSRRINRQLNKDNR